MKRFSGKIAVITGAGSGIGLATAQRLAAEGAMVVVADIDAASVERAVATIRNDGGAAEGRPGDVSQADQVERDAQEIVAAHGRIDVLVNNAGLSAPGAAEDYANFARSISVNLAGALYWSQAAARHSMLEHGGAIVNVASTGGLVGIPGDLGYVAGKHGLVGLTKALAIEWADRGIRVNCVAPGITASAMVRKVMEQSPAFIAERCARVPIGRVAEPEEQAAAIAFLASDEASYISGVTLPVDGGQMALHSGAALKRQPAKAG